MMASWYAVLDQWAKCLSLLFFSIILTTVAMRKKNVVSILISYIVGEKCREHFSKKENSNEYVIDSVHFTAPAIILRSGGGTHYNGL